MQGGVTIDSGVSSKSDYTVGSAITDLCTIVLNNFDGKFTQYDFCKASITVYIGMVVKRDYTGDTVEWVKQGVYNAYDYKGRNTITVSAYGNLSKSDSKVDMDVTYPVTLGNLAQQVCDKCGISLKTKTFHNSDYQIFRDPQYSSYTYHDVIANIAQLAGCYAQCNADGELEFKWFDYSTTPYNISSYQKYEPAKDNITVTGIKIDSKNVDAKSGTDGYVITLKDSDNKLLQAAIYEQVICDEWAVNINSAIKSKDTDVPARLAGIKSQCIELQNYCSRYGGTYNPTDAERKTFVDSANQYDADVKSCIAYLKDSANTVATAAFEPKQTMPDGLTKYISSYYETAQTGMAQEKSDFTANLDYITKKSDKYNGTNAWKCLSDALIPALYNDITSMQADNCFAGIDSAKIEYKGKLLTSADFSNLPGRLVTVQKRRDVANVQQIVDNIAPHLIGNTFRPYSATVYSNPALEAGDVVDIDGNKSVITNLTFKLNSAETISTEAKSQAENSSDFYSESEKLWDELQALNTKSEELRIKIQKLADGLESTVSKGDEMSDIKQLYNTIDLSVTNSETKTSAEIKMTADSITSSVNDKVGGLQSQITQQADEISSKVSHSELNSEVSTAITQSSDAVVYAFNHKDGSSQAVQFTGDGFDFYYGGSKLGHLGVAYNSEDGIYNMCVMPENGHGTYFSNTGSYAQVCMGAFKAVSIASDGLISTSGYMQAGCFKTGDGRTGKTEDMTLQDSSGKAYHLEFSNGLLVSSYY